MHNGDEYKFPWIANGTTGTTSTVSNIRVWTEWEYGLITPEDWQISIVCEWSTPPSPWWQPWVNTVLYVPMKTDLLDHWPNNISLTNTNVTIGTVGWVDAWVFPQTDTQNTLNADLSAYISWQTFTLSAWVYITEIPSTDPYPRWVIASSLVNNKWWCFNITSSQKVLVQSMGPFTEVGSTTSYSLWTRYNVVWVRTSSGKSVYINWNLENSDSNSWTSDYEHFYIWADRPSESAALKRHLRGYMADVILEDKARAAQEISDYFDATKATYWIS